LLDSLKELDTDSVRLPAAKTLAAPAAIAGHSLAAVSMKAMKHQLAVDTLKACGGNKSKAAKQLGVTRYTLDRLLK